MTKTTRQIEIDLLHARIKHLEMKEERVKDIPVEVRKEMEKEYVDLEVGETLTVRLKHFGIDVECRFFMECEEAEIDEIVLLSPTKSTVSFKRLVSVLHESFDPNTDFGYEIMDLIGYTPEFKKFQNRIDKLFDKDEKLSAGIFR